MTRASTSLAIVCVTLIAQTLPSAAQGTTTVFDNFGPGNAFTFGVGLPLDSSITRGFSFVPSATGFFHSAEMSLFLVEGPNAAQIAIHRSDPITGRPAEALELFNPASFPRRFESTDILSIQSAATPLLNTGNRYWLLVTAGPQSYLEWYSTTPFQNGLYITLPDDMRTLVEASAFRITVTPIPEPSAITLFLSAAAVLFLASGRPRFANAK